MHIAQWPCKKAISLYDDVPEHPTVVVRFDECNTVTGVDGSGVVHDYLEDHDQLWFGRKVAGFAWGATVPPDVAQLSAPPKLFEANTTPSFIP